MGNGELSWHGSLDIEQILLGQQLTVDVSGTRLRSVPHRERVLFGFSGLYREGPFRVSAEASGSIGAGEKPSYSGRITFGLSR